MALEAMFQFIPTNSFNLGGRKQVSSAQAHWSLVTILGTDTTEALKHLLLGNAGALTREHPLFALVGQSIVMVTKFCLLNEEEERHVADAISVISIILM